MTVPTILLSGLTLVSAAVYLRARYHGPQSQVYLFNPLTTALILSVTLLAPDPPSALYKWLVAAGLAFSLAGDIFLMLPGDYFIVGWAAFLLAHLVYIAAFVSDGGPYWSIWPLLLGLVYGVAILRYLWPHLGRLKAPAALYMLVIVLMAWQAAGRIEQTSGLSAWLAFAGAVLFLASDSIMTIYRFARPFASAPFMYMGAYYLAQWLIAMSVVAG